jgi:hypothetical protein
MRRGGADPGLVLGSQALPVAARRDVESSRKGRGEAALTRLEKSPYCFAT